MVIILFVIKPLKPPVPLSCYRSLKIRQPIWAAKERWWQNTVIR